MKNLRTMVLCFSLSACASLASGPMPPQSLPVGAPVPVSARAVLSPEIKKACVETPHAIYDGDTIQDAVVDLGFGVSFRLHSIRIIGLDAPERRGETLKAANASRDWLRAKISAAGNCFDLHTTGKRDRYGRWLGTVFVNGEDVAQTMIAQGLATQATFD